MDIVDMAVHPVVYQKSDLTEIVTSKMLAFQRYFGARS
jgi:hypothetical protein